MKQIYSLLTILLISLNIYGQRDTIIVSKYTSDTIELRIFEFENSTSWTINQTRANSCGLHIDSMKVIVSNKKTSPFLPNDDEYYPMRDSIISIVDSDTRLTVEAVIISNDDFNNQFTCYSTCKEVDTLNISCYDFHVMTGKGPSFYYPINVTFYFDKIDKKNIREVRINE